jgi:hypothetical protein
MTVENVSHRLVGNVMAQVAQGSDDAVVTPARVFPRHAHDESFHFRRDGGTTWILPVLGAIELFGHQLSIPGQNGVGLGDASNLPEGSTSQTLADLGQRHSLRVGESQSGGQLGTKNSVLGREVFVS